MNTPVEISTREKRPWRASRRARMATSALGLGRVGSGFRAAKTRAACSGATLQMLLTARVADAARWRGRRPRRARTATKLRGIRIRSKMRREILARRALFVNPAGTKGKLSLPARHEWGESRREGRSRKTQNLLSPPRSSLRGREERESLIRRAQVQGHDWRLFAVRGISPRCAGRGCGRLGEGQFCV